ncbi:hypothetical protein E2320_009530 [Naja naja]|nr:hypothetical protein E2320_009530 [Naja naja]
MLLLGTCLLYCARVLMPICVVTMSSRFDWDKKHLGIHHAITPLLISSSSAHLTLMTFTRFLMGLLQEIIVSLHDLAKGLSLSSKPTKVPWRKIFRKPPIWAVIVAQLCAASTFFTLLSWLPTFFSETGISVNIQDLAPSCAGLLFGVANTGGALLGVICVYLAGHLIENTGSWVSVFNLVAIVNALGLCTFLIFGKAHRMDLDPAYTDL